MTMGHITKHENECEFNAYAHDDMILKYVQLSESESEVQSVKICIYVYHPYL